VIGQQSDGRLTAVILAHGFMPAVSPKALTIRRWTLHHHSDKSLQDLAATYNPYIQGWIKYYGNFYRRRSTLKRIDLYVIRRARRKFKRLRRKFPSQNSAVHAT
jgi:RNA-directed DNA polymerase